jgi:hypothetical protein
MSEKQNRPLRLLWGAKAIAAKLNCSEREIFYMVEAGTLPVERVGRRLVANEEVLERRFGSKPAEIA